MGASVENHLEIIHEITNCVVVFVFVVLVNSKKHINLWVLLRLWSLHRISSSGERHATPR